MTNEYGLTENIEKILLFQKASHKPPFSAASQSGSKSESELEEARVKWESRRLKDGVNALYSAMGGGFFHSKSVRSVEDTLAALQKIGIAASVEEARTVLPRLLGRTEYGPSDYFFLEEVTDASHRSAYRVRTESLLLNW
jgi:hypothetical protein